MHRTYEGTNALVRITWFSDRIEILSPGGPFGQVTRLAILEPPESPTIATAILPRFLHQLGFVQRFGVGITIARNAMEKNGNPPPEFARTPTHVQVTFRRPA